MTRRFKSNEKNSEQHAANHHKSEFMNSSTAFDILAPHVVSTLPDSMARREEVLNALTVCAPPGHKCTPLLRLMQVHLEEHRRLQQLWMLEPFPRIPR
jgi:hypothetical protein